jgi:hypothetical protein
MFFRSKISSCNKNRSQSPRVQPMTCQIAEFKLSHRCRSPDLPISIWNANQDMDHWRLPCRKKLRQRPSCARTKQLFKVEDVENNLRSAIHEYDVSSNHNAFAIRRRRRQSAFQIDGNDGNVRLQRGRKLGMNLQLSLQTGWQSISLGQSWRKMPVITGVPAANLVTIVGGESISPAVVGIVMVFPFISPVTIAMTVIVILTVGEQGAC